jgi:hypothetical protein
MARRAGGKSPVRAPTPKKGAPPARKAGGKPGRSWLPLLGWTLGALAAGAAGFLAWSMPRGVHAWQPLGAGLGQARWVETAKGGPLAPPTAPDWVRQLRAWRIPWPTDLPVEPPAASFGSADGEAVAWFLVRSEQPEKELWHLEKDSVRIVDAAGHKIPWEGGTGAARLGPGDDLQALYLRLPPELAGAPGTTLRFRLRRSRRETTPELTFHLE